MNIYVKLDIELATAQAMKKQSCGPVCEDAMLLLTSVRCKRTGVG